MKNLYNFLLILLANLIFLSSAHSTTYYVNSATGNNSNTPIQATNIATPWLTVQHAIDNAAVVDGDNIVVAVGTYAGFNMTKRLNVIGFWKGSNPATNTVFNSIVTLSAPGGSASSRMVLKNLRVAESGIGDAIDVRNSYVTLENVFATTPNGAHGVRLNKDIIIDVLIEACNLNGSKIAGLYIPTFADVNGLDVRNTTFNGNGYWGIAAFQRRTIPTEVKNAHFSHCTFNDNNPTNQEEGHQVYFEKMKNSSFENVSVAPPVGNQWIGIDINVLSRTDYSNVSILNSRIIRGSPGSGIWIQARNDLPDPPASLDTVILRGLTFTNCDTNIAFNRQVKNMTVDKCDLSTYSVYGLVNFTDQDGTINASNNKWQNGGIPDTTVISGGLLVSGSPIISFMPSTAGIFVGMCIQGTGIQPGATVVSKSPNTVTMSDTATANGFIPGIGFAFNCVTSTDIVRTSLNFVLAGNPLPNSIINQANVSFPNVAAAITGTAAGGTIWNIPNTTIAGTTVIDRDLTLNGPGAGFLHSGSLTTFDNLTISNADLFMGSDFAVTNNFTPNHVIIGTDNTLIINGAIVPGGLIEGGVRSDMFFGGSSPSTALTTVEGGLRTLQLNRANGISLGDSLRLHRLLFLQSGLLSTDGKNLTLGPNTTIFNPNPTTSYVSTNGSGELRKEFLTITPTAFNYTVGLGAYSPVLVYFGTWNLGSNAYLAATAVNQKHPQNGCPTDYLNRYWVLRANAITNINANANFAYVVGDVIGNEAVIVGARFNGFFWNTFTPVNTVTHTFATNSITSFGDFTGGQSGCIGNLIPLVNAKIFLQGAYAGNSTMRTNINNFGFVPLSQPYNTSQFNYNGLESVTSVPAGVVDWVYIEIRSTPNGLPVPNGRRAAFVKSDGSIVDLDGSPTARMPSLTPGNYYIVIGHRTNVVVMSAAAQPISTTSALYDFTTGLGQYFGGDAATLPQGVFGLYSGDANRSFIISAADFQIVTNNLLQANYNDGDINMNGVVTATDYTFISTNLGKSSNVPNFP